MKTRYHEIPSYLTKDGSLIRELMHPSAHGNRQQSLAEAIVPAGRRTRLHRHAQSEELYHVTRGSGWMTLGDETLRLAVGDTVLIPPGTAHDLLAGEEEPLHLLCCCSPPYSHADTELL
mgnify:FL=1